MNPKQIKIIQSRLTNREKKFTLVEIRSYVVANYGEEELTEEQVSAIVDKLANDSNLVKVNSELNHNQKQTIIKEIASTLDINLPVEQIKLISQKLDWAISDRVKLKIRISEAITAWVDHQIEQEKQQTDEIMQNVQSHLAVRLQESNQHFNSKAHEFSQSLEEAIEKFRSTETEILDLFKIPS